MSTTGNAVTFPVVADEATYAAVHRVVTAVVALGGAVGWLAVPDRAETDAWTDEQVERAARGDGALALASYGGRVEALGTWRRCEDAVVRQNADVRKVMTHPDARGRGLARTVVTALTEHATAAGVEVLTLDARGNNHAAHALYESLGWQRCGVIPDFIGVGDERWDRVLFSRRLRTPEGVVLHGGAVRGPGASERRKT